ncbi:MAG: 3-oxoacyl-ACP reductase FabG [Verrucomicrobia bacterium]|nr:3-oxoacyl-ACP reductase FabG [Verrucomicrobiota bacterium]
MNTLFRLDNKAAIVTGAARGLGAAITKTLARQGARVAAVDIRFDEVEKIAVEAGNGAKAYTVDVSDGKQIRALVESVARDFGRIDILVNNAGICPRLPFLESTETDWEKIVSVNAKSQYFMMQAVCTVMKKQGGGRIINIASTGGRIGSFANASIYSGTKGAIVMFSKSVAREVAADGILVNCVAPGVMDTDLMRNLPPDRVKAICDQIPLKRLGRPEEIAAFVAFLASDECSYCTGATFDINGGWVML